jgi:CubicO group peptidase (beta-lactamase class C family)
MTGLSRRQLLRGAAVLSAADGRQPGASLTEAVALLDGAVASGALPAAVLHVGGPGRTLVRAFGKGITPDAIFLLASITKPMTAAAVMALVDGGGLSLDDPVRRHLPDFDGGDRPLVTIRHLLCHTSGLPDLPPDNLALRRRHAPLADFVAAATRAPLLYRPGTDVRYQSLGFLLAAIIAEKLTGVPFREHLRRTILAPLGMRGCSLGLGGRPLAATVPCKVPDDDWGWNSQYWRDLGSPWGGALGTAADITRLLRYFARPPRGGPLRPDSVRTMLTTQTPAGNAARFGLGWGLGGGGRGCSEATFGHSGSTGTMCWMDPARSLSFVLLTTVPMDDSRKTILQPVADLVSAAWPGGGNATRR